MDSHFDWSAVMPAEETVWPRKLTEGMPNTDLSMFIWILVLQTGEDLLDMLSVCFSVGTGDEEVVNIGEADG